MTYKEPHDSGSLLYSCNILQIGLINIKSRRTRINDNVDIKVEILTISNKNGST